MNTTIVDGVEIKQGDEVEVTSPGFEWIKAQFLSDIGENKAQNRYICEKAGTFPGISFWSKLRHIPKKQRVPLAQEDIIKKYWNGCVRNKAENNKNIWKIVGTGSESVAVSQVTILTYQELFDQYEITSGPDSNGAIVWEPCWKEV